MVTIYPISFRFLTMEIPPSGMACRRNVGIENGDLADGSDSGWSPANVGDERDFWNADCLDLSCAQK